MKKSEKAKEVIIVDDSADMEEYMTIVGSLAYVVSKVYESDLNSCFWGVVEEDLAFLRKALKMTDMQIIVLSILVEKGEPMSWRSLARMSEEMSAALV